MVKVRHGTPPAAASPPPITWVKGTTAFRSTSVGTSAAVTTGETLADRMEECVY